MIHDFWGIEKNNLNSEINELEGKIPTTLWKVINSIRRIGNIGAHMESNINLIVDIEPEEAQKLVVLIEYLIKEWYIERHDQDQLFTELINIDEQKQLKRKQN